MQDLPDRKRNTDFAWSKFDPDEYVSHYYSQPHPDDDRAVHLTCRALAGAEPRGSSLKVVDVGTGPNLFPLLAALPRSAEITSWEYSEANLRWLDAEMARPTIREPWGHFWGIVREAYGQGYDLPDDPMAALGARTDIRGGSVYELPERQWDAATMFFCAESITESKDEFEHACTRFARSVRRGGTIAAAFLLSSDGYVVAGHRYPVLKLSEEMLRHTFESIADSLRIEIIGEAVTEIRSGYSRMAFLTGRSR